MKSLIYLLLITLFLQTCAPPTSTRDFGKFVKTGDAIGDGQEGADLSNDDDDDDDSDSNNDDFEELETGDGFDICDDDWSGSIGYVSACKGNHDAGDISYELKVSLSEDDLVSGTCFIPMHEYTTGNNLGQRYIGPADCLHHQADATYETNLNLFQNEQFTTFNAVMAIKPQSIDAFFRCMDAAADFIAINCPFYNGDDYACQVANAPLTCQSGQNQVCLGLAAQTQEYECSIFTNQHDYVLLSF